MKDKTYPWGFLAIPFVLLVVGVFSLVRGRRGRGWGALIFQWSYVVFMASVLVVSVVTYSLERARLIRELDAGKTVMVEGPITFFHAGRSSRGATSECFNVRERCFCYSEFVVSPAFNDTAVGGGPIRAGLWVRVRSVAGSIVQLETRDN